MTINRLSWKIKEKLIEVFLQKPRVLFYSFLSNIKVNAEKYQPVLANGEGIIKIGKNVNFGVRYSKDYYTRYGYLNARRKESYIEIGDNTWINNNITIISDGTKISIGKNCLIGTDVEILDSNFHDLDPNHRFGGKNILKAASLTATGKSFGNKLLEDTKHRVALSESIWPSPGEITKIDGIETAKGLKGFEYIYFRYDVGDTIVRYTDCTKRVCFIIVSGNNYIEAKENMAAIKNAIRITV